MNVRCLQLDEGLQTIETLETLLEHLSLSNLANNFHTEQIDLDALVCLTSDLALVIWSCLVLVNVWGG